VRQQADGGQRPHLGRIRAQGQDGDERQTELGDLVAQDGDRLAEPESPEIRCVEEESRDEAIDGRGAQPRLGGQRRC
jgi:hypothetical protein